MDNPQDFGGTTLYKIKDSLESLVKTTVELTTTTVKFDSREKELHTIYKFKRELPTNLFPFKLTVQEILRKFKSKDL
jgi:hypothetical protein